MVENFDLFIGGDMPLRKPIKEWKSSKKTNFGV